MAYPLRLFDINDEEDKRKATKFYQTLSQLHTDLFGVIHINDKVNKYHSWDTSETPQFLKTLATETILKVVKELPEGELKLKGSVGVYGRKVGSVIKKSENILYRIIINIGSTEVYFLEADSGPDPLILIDGYALICSPAIIDKVNIKVMGNPIRKNLSPNIAHLIPKIRERDYMRSTIVIDMISNDL